MPKKEKILFVITKSNFGGAQRYVYDLATHLPKEKYDVAVVHGTAGEAADEPGLLFHLLTNAGIRTIYIPGLGRDVSILRDVRALRALIHIFQDERPDIVHLNSSKIGGLGALAGRIARVPRIVYTAHGWAFREARNVLMRTAIWLVSLATILLAHATICVSEADRRAFARIPFARRKIARIYNGIDFSTTFSSGERIRSAFPAGAHITGTIGELTKNKNQIALIDEARKKPAMYVAIVGDGELRSDLERHIQAHHLGERVKLFGFIPASEVMRGFDCFALPSLKEGLPYVLLEARLANIPIIANHVGGVDEVLRGDINDFSLERMVHETEATYRKR